MHNGCILCGGVGVGKSHTAIGYYLENEAPKDVYVITTAKKRDKQDWQLLWGDVGMTGNPENTMGALVTVDSWENIKKYEEVKDAFFIFDEQRLVGTGRWVKAFYKIAAQNRFIMLSATPGDNWLDYVPIFRANGFIKNITQFKEDHVVSRWTGRYYQVIGYRQVPKLVRWRNQLLVDMPYEKHTTRHHHEIAVEYDKDLVRELVNKRWHVYEKRPLTDASELFRVMRKVVYSDASRLEALRGLLKKHPKLIVFYNFDFELELLRTLADSSGKVESGTESSGRTSSSTSAKHSTNGSSKATPASTASESSPIKSTSPGSATKDQASEKHSLSTSTTNTDDPWEVFTWTMERQEAELKKAWAKGLPETGRTIRTTDTSHLEKSSNASSEPSQTPNGSSSRNGFETAAPEANQKEAADSENVQQKNDASFTLAEPNDHNQKETETWQNRSTPDRPNQPRRSVGTSDTKETYESSGKSESSPKKSSTRRSSRTSQPNSDLSTSTSASGSSSQFQVAEWNGHKHEEVPTTTSWVYLVQYVAGAEAWECIETDAICFFSMPYSYKTWWQAHGRIDRLNTSFLDLHYYTLFGGSIIEKSVKKALAMKKSFNESALARSMGF